MQLEWLVDSCKIQRNLTFDEYWGTWKEHLTREKVLQEKSMEKIYTGNQVADILT